MGGDRSLKLRAPRTDRTATTHDDEVDPLQAPTLQPEALAHDPL
jgi:hypothetical protein